VNDHTNTMWVILMTPQKKVLARISQLKIYGKIKVGEWKVMYGKKNMAGWVFRILGQPASRTYSFHDGEVAFKTQRGYLPLRKIGIRLYIYVGLIFCLWVSWNSIVGVWSEKKNNSAPIVESQVKPMIEEKAIIQESVNLPEIQKIDPKFHEIFLETKRSYQFGSIEAASRLLQNNLDNFDEMDRAQAVNMISERYYLECEKWIREHDERKAVLACEKSVKNSSHEKASSYLRTQDEKAKKLYLEGYTAVKLNPALAKQKFTQVLQAAKTKSTWRGKAQYQLRKLKRI
jgi:hypothetical protein